MVILFPVPLIILLVAIYFLVRWQRQRDHSWIWALLFFNLAVVSVAVEYYYTIKIEVRAGVAKTKHYFASQATAIEAFYDDHGKYPPYQIRSDGTPMAETIIKPENDNMTLTTPIEYISSVGWDWFNPDDAVEHLDNFYAYRCDPEDGWILGSRGPDKDWDIDYINSYDISKGESAFPGDPEFLIPWTYDITNGIWSSGDIWRVKQ